MTAVTTKQILLHVFVNVEALKHAKTTILSRAVLVLVGSGLRRERKCYIKIYKPWQNPQTRTWSPHWSLIFMDCSTASAHNRSTHLPHAVARPWLRRGDPWGRANPGAGSFWSYLFSYFGKAWDWAVYQRKHDSPFQWKCAIQTLGVLKNFRILQLMLGPVRNHHLNLVELFAPLGHAALAALILIFEITWCPIQKLKVGRWQWCLIVLRQDFLHYLVSSAKPKNIPPSVTSCHWYSQGGWDCSCSSQLFEFPAKTQVARESAVCCNML